MPFRSTLRTGSRVPPAMLAELDENGQVKPVQIESLLVGVKALIIGIPGAFTPVCTSTHLPPFIEKADALKRSGFQHIICVASCDPFSLDAWASFLDPQRKIRYLSDGNLDFIRAAQLATNERELFLGERSARYAMIVENAVVTRLSVEQSVLNVTCAGADAFELDS